VIATSHTISTAENGAVIYARIKIQLTLVLKRCSFAFGVDESTIKLF
jgi:hypothetical protein